MVPCKAHACHTLYDASALSDKVTILVAEQHAIRDPKAQRSCLYEHSAFSCASSRHCRRQGAAIGQRLRSGHGSAMYLTDLRSAVLAAIASTRVVLLPAIRRRVRTRSSGGRVG